MTHNQNIDINVEKSHRIFFKKPEIQDVVNPFDS